MTDLNHDFLKTIQHLETTLGDPTNEQSEINFARSVTLDEAQAFPHDYIRYLTDIGYFSHFVPTEMGGQLHEFSELLLLCRTLSRRDLTAAIATGQTMLGALPVWLCGDQTQKSLLAEHILQGHLGCLALTEKRHGSNLLASEVSATEHADDYQLNGEKWLINNATQGHTMTILVRKYDHNQRESLAVLLLDKTCIKDFENIEKINTHGIRCADISGIRFNNTQVPKSAIIQTNEPGMYGVLKALQISRILCAGFSLGAFDTCLRLTYDFAKSRALYQKTVLDMPTVQQGLGRSFAKLLVAEMVSLASSKTLNYAGKSLSVYSASCKYWVPKTTELAIDELKVILGARYYLRDEYQAGMFQKMQRDNAVVSLFDGSSQLNLGLISSQTNAIASKLLDNPCAHPDIAAWFDLNTAKSLSTISSAMLSVNNMGQDPILASFLAITEQRQFDRLDANLQTVLHTLKQQILSWCDTIQTLQHNEQNEPASVVRFAATKQYTQLFAASCCALYVIFNPSHPLLGQSDIAQDLLTVILDDSDLWVPSNALLGTLDTQHQNQSMYSLLALPK
ncbi:acyl-CoA dehydrogenase [Pseudoalteromonas sp. MSK9-3]|uniref:acyl-CoA dehydrogenase family protein n=1 Tax=Pseudoalteromonas sp. MSK9-3 TaxID=1897633 RepID=UPI000E6D1B40|nr:acyl-CoA dehydrogenase family protein [Pseudoalteromonas sp. MSK9-3]RJE71045.1 acyl-CoA dehydrogenase [Pseudoalteromonas sp. MSK9-3]